MAQAAKPKRCAGCGRAKPSQKRRYCTPQCATRSRSRRYRLRQRQAVRLLKMMKGALA